MPTDSSLHLSAEALNAVLAKFADRPGEMTVRFEQGRFRVDREGLVILITHLEVTPEGVDIRLQIQKDGAKP